MADEEDDKLGDAPIQQHYIAEMNMIARTLDTIFNGDARGADRETGFVLLVFPVNRSKDNRVNYISNGANREDVIKLLREQADKFETDIAKSKERMSQTKCPQCGHDAGANTLVWSEYIGKFDGCHQQKLMGYRCPNCGCKFDHSNKPVHKGTK